MQKVSRVELVGLVRRVLKQVQPLDSARDKSHATLIALRGDLGAGKTTFVQALAKELGVTKTVQSPTYVLMKVYEICQGDALTSRLYKAPFKKLIHVDAYRLKNAEEFAALKPEQFLNDPGALVCIEWPERVEDALPTPDIVLNFSSDPPAGEEGAAGDQERYIGGI